MAIPRAEDLFPTTPKQALPDAESLFPTKPKPPAPPDAEQLFPTKPKPAPVAMAPKSQAPRAEDLFPSQPRPAQPPPPKPPEPPLTDKLLSSFRPPSTTSAKPPDTWGNRLVVPAMEAKAKQQENATLARAAAGAPMVPDAIVKHYAEQGGIPQEDVDRYGTVNSDGKRVVGFPTQPQEVHPSAIPALVKRLRTGEGGDTDPAIAARLRSREGGQVVMPGVRRAPDDYGDAPEWASQLTLGGVTAPNELAEETQNLADMLDGESKAQAAAEQRALNEARARQLTEMRAPSYMVRPFARAGGIPEEDIERLGTSLPDSRVVTGFPVPPTEISPAESPEMVDRMRNLTARQQAQGDYGTRGITYPNSIRTLEGDDSSVFFDYNPLVAALGFANELYKTTAGSKEQMDAAVRFLLNKTPENARALLATKPEGFMPPSTAPAFNLGGRGVSVPMALGGLVGKSLTNVGAAIEKDGLGGAVESMFGARNGEKPIGNVWAGDSAYTEKDYKWFVPDYMPGPIAALIEGVAKIPEEILGIGLATAHGGIGVYHAFQKAIDPDATAEEVVGPAYETALDVGNAVVRDLVKLGVDPQDLASRGILNAMAVATPFSQAAAKMLKVGKAEGAAAKARFDMLPENADQMYRSAAGELSELEGVASKKQQNLNDANEAFKQATEQKVKLDNSQTPPGPGVAETVNANLVARTAEQTQAAADAAAANAAVTAHLGVWDGYLKKAGADSMLAEALATKLSRDAAGRSILAAVPTYVATLGAGAVWDGVAMLIERSIGKPGRAYLRQALYTPEGRAQAVGAATREAAVYKNTAVQQLQDAYRAIPLKHRATVFKAWLGEFTAAEGDFGAVGLNNPASLRHFDGAKFDISEAGHRALAEADTAIGAAYDVMNNSLPTSAEYIAAEKVVNQKFAWRQSLVDNIELSNRYVVPFIEVLKGAEPRRRAHGFISGESQAAEYAGRQAKAEAVAKGLERSIKAAETRNQIKTGSIKYQHRPSVKVVQRVAGKATRQIESAANAAKRQAARSFEREMSAASRIVASTERSYAQVLKQAGTVPIKSATSATTARIPAKVDLDASIAIERQYAEAVDQAKRTYASTTAPMQKVLRSFSATSAERQAATAGLAQAKQALTSDVATAAGTRSTTHTPVTASAASHAKRVVSRQMAAEGARAKGIDSAALTTNDAFTALADDTLRADTRSGKATASIGKSATAGTTQIESTRDRYIARANEALDKEIADLTAKAQKEVDAIYGAKMGGGLSDAWMPQSYPKLRVERVTGEKRKTDGKGGLLAYEADLSSSHGSKYRQGGYSVTQRIEQKGMSPELGDAVDSAAKTFADIAIYDTFEHLDNTPGVSLTVDQFREVKAVEFNNAYQKALSQGMDDAAARTAAKAASVSDKRFVHVPDEYRFKDGEYGGPGSGPKRYGKLSGKYILEDVFAELQGMELLREDMGLVANKVLTTLKGFKTVHSIITTTRNMASGVLLLAPAAGLSLLNPGNWKYMYQAIADMMMKVKPERYRQANKYGLHGGDMFANELGIDVLGDIHSGALETASGPVVAALSGVWDIASGGASRFLPGKERQAWLKHKENRARLAEFADDPAAFNAQWAAIEAAEGVSRSGERLYRGLDRLKQAWKLTWDLPGLVYSAQDGALRLATIYKSMAENAGKWTDDFHKAETARISKAYVDTRDIPGAAQALRMFRRMPISATKSDWVGPALAFTAAGSPFIAWGAAAAKMMSKWPSMKPWHVILNEAVHKVVTASNLRSMGLTQEDRDAILATGNQWQQTDILVGEMMPEYGFDEEGRPRSMNVNYIGGPGGATLAQVSRYDSPGENAAMVAKSIFSGTPFISALTDAAKGLGLFGKDIVNESTTARQYVANLANAAVGALAPAWTPSPSDLFGEDYAAFGADRFKGSALWENWKAAQHNVPNRAGRVANEDDFIRATMLGMRSNVMNPTENILGKAAMLISTHREALKAAWANNHSDRSAPAFMSPDALAAGQHNAHMEAQLDRQAQVEAYEKAAAVSRPLAKLLLDEVRGVSRALSGKATEKDLIVLKAIEVNLLEALARPPEDTAHPDYSDGELWYVTMNEAAKRLHAVAKSYQDIKKKRLASVSSKTMTNPE